MNALILLSHLMTKEGYLEIESKSRAEEAYRVAQKESADYLITNGWNYRKDCKLSLADAFSNYLKEKEKLRKCSILCQRFSRDTVGDAIFSYLFLEHLNRKFYKRSKIIVISSQYHIKRVEYIFTRIFNLKINFIGVPDKKFNYPIVDKLKNSEERSLNEFKESFDDVESGNIFLFYKKLREMHPLYNGDIHQKIPDLKATLNDIKKSINIK